MKKPLRYRNFWLSEESHSKKFEDNFKATNKHVGVVCEEKLLDWSEVF